MFGIATGWLGWPPSETWNCAVIEILMAWEAKVGFLKMTNPFGQAPEQPSKKEVARDMRVGLRAAAAGRKQQ